MRILKVGNGGEHRFHTGKSGGNNPFGMFFSGFRGGWPDANRDTFCQIIGRGKAFHPTWAEEEHSLKLRVYLFGI